MKVYLGDSVYAELVNGMILLTINNGYGPTNSIYLEPAALDKLNTFAVKLSEPPAETPPGARYPHNCSVCESLGTFEEFDLYFCPSPWVTVIARYGDGSDYKSGLPAVGVDDALTEAARRAVAAGHLDADTKTGAADGHTVGEWLV